MPYADKDKMRAAQAKWYRKKYGTDEAFRLTEAIRKAEWLQTDEGRASNLEASKRARCRKPKS